MDKPVSVPVKKWLIRRVAVDTVVDERIVDSVVSHQFETAREAIGNVNSIELSGFGRFYFNNKKAEKKLQRYNDIKRRLEDIINTSDVKEKRISAQFKLGVLIGDINVLKRKLGYED